MTGAFQVTGTSQKALFTLKLHRGDGMALVAMNWKKGKPPDDFVGFAIEYKEPGGDRFFALKNRLCFPGADGSVNPNTLSTRLSPIQKFRWVHFPRNAELAGEFTYKVTPVFMNAKDELSYGEPQEAAIELRRETYPGKLNVTFTRGFVSSQAFVDKYGADAIPTLLPAKADAGLDFVPTHPKAEEALAWMGFEARSAILEVLDQAIADKSAQVRAVVYDLNEPGMVVALREARQAAEDHHRRRRGPRKPKSAETQAADAPRARPAARSSASTWASCSTTRSIVVDGPKVQAAVVRLDQPLVARLLRAEQQRHHPARQEGRQDLPWPRFDAVLGARRRGRLRRRPARRSGTSSGWQGSTRRSASRRDQRRTRC